MESSIVSRLFRYRQLRDDIAPIENFLTEYFAFCLETDESFREDFFKELEIDYKTKNDFRINTQEINKEFGRPDIEIRFLDTYIIIESKVESLERINQLEDYANILFNETAFKKKYLIYLTKYLENKELSHNNVELRLKRWCDIYRIIKTSHKEFTQQLKLFLKEQKMETIKNFTIEDCIVIKNRSMTEAKVNEILNYFKPIFTKQFGSFSISNYEGYYGYSTLRVNGKDYYIGLGFFNYDELPVPYLGVYISLPKKKFENTEILKTFKKEFRLKKNWEYNDDIIDFGAYKQITDFNNDDDDNIPAMKKFIEVNLSIIITLKNKYPKYFKR